MCDECPRGYTSENVKGAGLEDAASLQQVRFSILVTSIQTSN